VGRTQLRLSHIRDSAIARSSIGTCSSRAALTLAQADGPEAQRIGETSHNLRL